MDNLGILFNEQGQYDKALDYHKRALDIRQKTLGQNHTKVADTLFNTGLVYANLSEYRKALEYIHKSMTIWEKALGSNHPDIAWSLRELGYIYIHQGRYKEALNPLERLVALCSVRTCEADPHGLGLIALARALVETKGDKQRAIKLARQSEEIFAKSPKRFDNELKKVKSWLARYATATKGRSSFAEEKGKGISAAKR